MIYNFYLKLYDFLIFIFVILQYINYVREFLRYILYRVENYFNLIFNKKGSSNLLFQIGKLIINFCFKIGYYFGYVSSLKN